MQNEDRFERNRRLKNMVHNMRLKALDLAYAAGKNGAHIGGGFSAMEIMAVLYGYVLNFDPINLRSELRDRFILSKGHGTLAYYTALYEAGILSEEILSTYEKNGSDLPGQPVRNLDIGIESASGSLGMGLSIGVGLALAAKLSGRNNRVFVLIGDGECNEGSVWEAAMSAMHFKLDNLFVIIDQNGMQSDGFCCDVFNISDLSKSWAGFGWKTVSADGHDVEDLCNAFDEVTQSGGPAVIMARTVKGKGLSFAENEKGWHHGVISKELYEKGLAELKGESTHAGN